MQYKYLFNIPGKNRNKELLKWLDSQASELDRKMSEVDFSGLGLSEYNFRYLNDIRRNIVGYFQVYNYLIETALKHTEADIRKSTFVDYGGGSGLLSLLAKQIGFGTVVYNDIYPVSCEDAKKLAGKLNIAVDHFVPGGIDDLLAYFSQNGLSARFVVGSDVIEHIYDVEDFLRKIPELSEHQLTMVMGTGATPFNPRVRRKLVQGHLRSEYDDRTITFGHKPSDTLESFFKIRKSYIQEKLKTIPEEELHNLARQTRGLKLTDIDVQLEEYRKNGKMTYKPRHSSNTCDPYSGNWNEQLHDVDHLISILKESGFNAEVISSYYMHSGNKAIQNVKQLINLLIRISGRAGLYISPYYILKASRGNDQ